MIMEYPVAIGDWRPRFIFVANGSRVIDMTDLADLGMKLPDFRNMTAHIAFEETGPRGGAKKVKLVDKWLTDPQRMSAHDTIYRPGEARVVEVNGRLFVNTFRFPDHPAIKTPKVKRFLDHIEYLWPDCSKLILDFLAHIVQHPATRPKIAPLHIARQHGVGRGWVVELMTQVLGPWNVTSTTMQQLSGYGGGGQFQGYLANSLLCAIHETRATDKAYQVDDAVRDKLTEPRLHLNRKYGQQGEMDVCTRFLMFSNHQNAVAIKGEDRRLLVTAMNGAAKTERYYERLYGPLDKMLPAHVFWYLKRRDISGFNPGMRAPMNAAKKRMIGVVTSNLSFAIAALVDEGIEVVTFDQARRYAKFVQSGEHITPAALTAALRDDASIYEPGAKDAKIKIEGLPQRVWLLGNQDKWEGASTTAIRREIGANDRKITKLIDAGRP